MVKKKFILFRDQISDFSRKDWESKVIGVKGNIVLVEAEVSEEDGGMSAYRVEETVNESGEC